MGIVDRNKRINKSEELIDTKKTENSIVEGNTSTNIDISFTNDELEFLIRMIGNSNFKGNDFMFVYDLVNKLQNLTHILWTFIFWF